jgi:hypothetical protein
MRAADVVRNVTSDSILYVESGQKKRELLTKGLKVLCLHFYFHETRNADL